MMQRLDNRRGGRSTLAGALTSALMAALALSACGPGGSARSDGGGVGVPAPSPPPGPGEAPQAVVVSSVRSGVAPLTVEFDASSSIDPDGDIVLFEWSFGDGASTAVGALVSHVYESPGDFMATVTVKDSQGATAMATLALHVSSESCPTFLDGVSPGTLESASITEASGVAMSRRSAGVLWVNNDSGDSARVFAMTTAGTHLGAYSISGASAYDWEDVAVGPGPEADVSYLYMGDIGDNARARSYVTIYRVPEPPVSDSQAPVTTSLTGAERIQLRYTEGVAHDAETLLVDPLSADVFIVTKVGDGHCGVYRAPFPQDTSATATMEHVGDLTFGSGSLSGGTTTTGGDISPDGRWIIVRTYSSAFLWRRHHGGTVADAFLTEPCRLPLRSEPQGEAIGFDSSGSGYFTVSEGSHPPLHYFALGVSP